MYVTAISPRFSLGRSTPATRAISLLALVRARALPAQFCSGGRHRRGPRRPPPNSLPLSLLVPRVLADDPRDPLPLDDLAVLAAYLDRRPNFHISRST